MTMEKLEELLKGATVTYKIAFDNQYHSFPIDHEAERLKVGGHNTYLEKANGNPRIGALYWNGFLDYYKGEWFITLAPEIKAHLTETK